MAVLRLRHLPYGLLLSWVGTTIIFAGALLIEPPNSHRLIIATPAIMLLAAIALSEFGRLLAAGARRSQGVEGPPGSASLPLPALLPALLIVAIFFTVGDIIFYFGRYQNEHTFADRNTEIAHEMADYLNSLDGQWSAYFYGPPSMFISFPTIPFLASDFQGGINLFDVNEPNASLPSAPTPDLTFIFLPERINELATVRALHPNGRERTFAGFHADPLFYVYEVEGQ
jgi:hypothetical protein